MRVSVVIPTFKRPRALSLTLEALTKVGDSGHELEVLVVDDAVEPGTAVAVDPFRDRLDTTLLSQERRGAAAARNVGARAATGQLLLFLDDDMLVEPGHVAAHVATHDAYPGSMVGSHRWYTPGALALLDSTPFGRFRVNLEREFVAALEERRLEGDCVETALLPANDLSVSREAFWDLGGFDESFPHAGAEDQDLSLRARQAGLRLIRNYAIRPGHEEDMVTLERFGWREERGAETVVVLGRRFPEAVGRFNENAPPRRGDRLGTVAKKVAKRLLGSDPAIAGLHQVAKTMERLRLPDRALHRLYRAILGAHIARGYRRALRARP